MLVAAFIIIPTVNEIQSIKTDITMERMELEEKFRQGQLIRKVLQDFKEAKNEQKTLEAVYIEPGKELNFITHLENLALSHNLEQTLTKTAGDKNEDTRLPIEIRLEGNFIQAMRYIADLESMDYYFLISDIRILSKNTKTGETSTSVVGSAFFNPNK